MKINEEITGLLKFEKKSEKKGDIFSHFDDISSA